MSDPNARPTGDQPLVTPLLLGKDTAPRIYVEGLSQLNLGYPLSRLVMHHTVEPSADPVSMPERRHIACELVIPTLALIDMMQGTLAGLTQAKDVLPRFHADFGEKLRAMLDSVTVTSSEEPPTPGHH